MSKGFVRLLEAIIAAIILIGSMSYFFSIHTKPSGWTNSLLETNGRDALVSLDKSNQLRFFISENSITGLVGLFGSLENTLPKSSRFSVQMENIPKPNITLGCICSPLERSRLKKIIGMDSNYTVMTADGRKIKILVDNDEGEKLFAKSNIDILVFFSYPNLSVYKEETEAFLDKNKAILVISDTSGFESDEYTNSLFGTEFASGTPDKENNFVVSGPGNVSGSIADYFTFASFKVMTNDAGNGERTGLFNLNDRPYSFLTGSDAGISYINFSTVKYGEGQTFPVDRWSLKVMRIQTNASLGDTYVEMMIMNKSFQFNMSNTVGYNGVLKNNYTVLATANGFSSCQARDSILNNTKGRAAWIKNYDESRDDINQLSKSLILWLSSEKYILNDNVGVVGDMPNQYTMVHYTVVGSENPEPYKISLIMWYIF